MEGRSQQDSADEARADDARRLAIVADPGPAKSVLSMEPSRR
jgi:hypothetical protein